MLEINNTTIINTKGYEITNVSLFLNPETNQWSSVVNYSVKDEQDNIVSTGALTYYGEEFNTWNTNWKNDRFLYEELIQKLELDVSAENIEENFENTI